MIIAVPTGIKIFSRLATLWGGLYFIVHHCFLRLALGYTFYHWWFNWCNISECAGIDVALHDTYYV